MLFFSLIVFNFWLEDDPIPPQESSVERAGRGTFVPCKVGRLLKDFPGLASSIHKNLWKSCSAASRDFKFYPRTRKCGLVSIFEL